MAVHVLPTNPVGKDPPRPNGSDLIAPDCRGLNFFEIDPAIQGLLQLYLSPELNDHLAPHFSRLGMIAGGRLDELSELCDKHPPQLHHRNRFGRDEDWIEFHPAYREMEKIAFGEFGIHAATHRPGVLGWRAPLPYVAKYALQYLFVQSEFGLMCPVSATDTSAFLIKRYGSAEVKERFYDRMISQDMGHLLKGAQFMTEKAGGSDIGNSALTAIPDSNGETWRLYGDKWFCSCADGDVALLLARPQGAPEGSRGLALFAMPRHLEDGSRNHYRIIRLKDKLGTRSMASGEIMFEGATAYLLGEPNRGLKQMMDQVNLSRLSHGIRAAAMMRRCLNEAFAVARNRQTFGRTIIEHPLLRRQLLKLMVPTEQVLSVALYGADLLTKAEAGDAAAAARLRIITPLLKCRSARDNITVATGAMEVRGGNGYIEDWVNARLVRDAHLGVLWEGTSNINALDVISRAVGKERAHEALAEELHSVLTRADQLPGQYRGELRSLVDRAVTFAARVAANPEREPLSRRAAGGLYHVTSAVLMADEGQWLGAVAGDARRLVLSRMVVAHRLGGDGMFDTDMADWQTEATDLLLSGEAIAPEVAQRLVQSA
jgi:alkylation response protein AidB-like acyl-CoA dehydrogenase